MILLVTVGVHVFMLSNVHKRKVKQCSRKIGSDRFLKRPFMVLSRLVFGGTRGFTFFGLFQSLVKKKTLIFVFFVMKV